MKVNLTIFLSVLAFCIVSSFGVKLNNVGRGGVQILSCAPGAIQSRYRPVGQVSNKIEWD